MCIEKKVCEIKDDKANELCVMSMGKGCATFMIDSLFIC